MFNSLLSTDRIFVAGSSGMVGSAICRKLKEYWKDTKKGNLNLLNPTSKELNLLDFKSTENWFKEKKPDIVILAAAKVGGF